VLKGEERTALCKDVVMMVEDLGLFDEESGSDYDGSRSGSGGGYYAGDSDDGGFI